VSVAIGVNASVLWMNEHAVKCAHAMRQGHDANCTSQARRASRARQRTSSSRPRAAELNPRRTRLRAQEQPAYGQLGMSNESNYNVTGAAPGTSWHTSSQRTASGRSTASSTRHRRSAAIRASLCGRALRQFTGIDRCSFLFAMRVLLCMFLQIKNSCTTNSFAYTRKTNE
jgi:hypothetical protein